MSSKPSRSIAGVFNISKFIRAMRERRENCGKLGYRAVADQIGISHMAYYNIEQGRVIPTLESFIRIVLWMDSDAELFVIKPRKSMRSVVSKIRYGCGARINAGTNFCGGGALCGECLCEEDSL